VTLRAPTPLASPGLMACRRPIGAKPTRWPDQGAVTLRASTPLASPGPVARLLPIEAKLTRWP
jgi:hypothetical protein